jgi:hypothetical protein
MDDKGGSAEGLPYFGLVLRSGLKCTLAEAGSTGPEAPGVD